MTALDFAPIPERLRLEPLTEPDIREGLPEAFESRLRSIVREEVRLALLDEALNNPETVIARIIRGFTLEQITTLCRAMGNPNLRDTLVNWAVSHLDGTPLPEEKKRVI
jgi:hypothetical protein